MLSRSINSVASFFEEDELEISPTQRVRFAEIMHHWSALAKQMEDDLVVHTPSCDQGFHPIVVGFTDLELCVEKVRS